MTAVTIPFSENLQLGRAVNLNTMTLGAYIGKQEGNTMQTDLDRETLNSSMVTSEKAVKSELNIKGKLSLHLDLGMDVLGGFEGRYHKLSTSMSKEGAMAVLISSETVVESFKPKSSWLDSDWKNLVKDMTHFVSSVTYGGYLDIIFETSRSSFMTDQEMAATLSVALPMLSIGLDAEGAKADSSRASDEQFKISLSGTSIKLKHQPRSMDEVGHLVDDFLENVKSGNDGKGSPVICTLLPISALDASIKPEDTGMEALLPKVKVLLDNINAADALLLRKMGDSSFVSRLEKYQEEKVVALQESVDEAKQRLQNALRDAKSEPLKQVYKELREKKGFLEEAQALIESCARECIPGSVLSSLKSMAGYASWHAANTKVGYLDDAKADMKTAESYFYNVRNSKFFSERCCNTLRSMAWAAAWHAACSCFQQEKEAKRYKERLEACRFRLIGLSDITEKLVNDLHRLCWSSAWFTAFTRCGDDKEASRCTKEIQEVMKALRE